MVKSTKGTNRIEAAEVAEAILATLKAKKNTQDAQDAKRSFAHYADKLITYKSAQAKSASSKRSYTDEYKLLYRAVDGVATYLGALDVGKITAGTVRGYLHVLDTSRAEPLATSTRSKHSMMIRKVLMLALDDGIKDIVPTMPKRKTVDIPRVSFSGKEYKHLLEVARACADRGDVVRGVEIARVHDNLIVFPMH